MSNQSPFPEKMRAIIRNHYGGPDVVEIAEIERPEPDDDQLLVRVRAASLNRADRYAVTGLPLVSRPIQGLRKPKYRRLGTDYAGVVEAVGKNVSGFRPGDEVFGGRDGALAEYVCPRHDRAMVLKPVGVTFEQAAAVPVAALTALQGLRDKGGIQPGQQVLINGASGGVGTFAVQIAKAFGAEVTAVCSTRGVEVARSIGADHLIDYNYEDFTRIDRRFDLMLDVAGTRSLWACRRVLSPQATVVVVGGPKTNRLIGPLGHVIRMRLGGLVGRRKTVFFIAKFNKADMETLREMLEAGKLRPVIDRRYEFEDCVEAFRYMEDGHPQGKVVITL